MGKVRVPSPATVLATVAIFAAFAGGAYAAGKIDSGDIKNNSIQGKDVKANTLKGADVDEGSLDLPGVPVTYAAQVDDQGAACTLSRKVPTSAAITVADPNGGTQGQCDVTLPQPVSTCVYQVSIGRPTQIATLNGEITTEPVGANVLRVYSFQSNGAVADRPFGITVAC
jgi:hypothetical protein